LTGWLTAAGGPEAGFQITFFRTRPGLADDNPSAFAPRQLLIGHAALTDPRAGQALHDQRIAREGFALAAAAAGKAHVWIDDWSLEQREDRWHAVISAQSFALQLISVATQPPLLHGAAGYSRKGADADAASYYYSMPHLAVSGTLAREGKSEQVTGVAWLDHEWSSTYMPRDAAGWDWIGINADDGGSLMAFRMRGRNGNSLWTAATQRTADGVTRTHGPSEVRFESRRNWRSTRTGVAYPVAMQMQAGSEIETVLEPLIDDQEYDARSTTGTIYWEGAVRASRQSKPYGKGYMELTGYWQPMRV
jgi:predicted secreted hydrolase